MTTPRRWSSLSSDSGMSLVEVLVAMTVAGAVMLAGLTALQVGLSPILRAGVQAREVIQIVGVHRAVTRDANSLSPKDVLWELRPASSGHGYDLVRVEERDGQWFVQVMLDGVDDLDWNSDRLRVRSGSERWVEITPRRLSEP
jgi:prepilin-type N-terminal cleavage/methylation domain-containing protein